MRKIALFAILLAFPAILLAQDDSRFSTDGASVKWQNVYQTQLDSAGVVDALLASGKFDGFAQTKDGFTCKILQHEVNWRGMGIKRGALPMYMLGGELDAHATVQIREGRYRVTVDRIVFTDTVSGGLFVPGKRTRFEDYALNRRGEFRGNFWNPGTAPVLDFDLFSLFEIQQEQSAQDEDW